MCPDLVQDKCATGSSSATGENAVPSQADSRGNLVFDGTLARKPTSVLAQTCTEKSKMWHFSLEASYYTVETTKQRF